MKIEPVTVIFLRFADSSAGDMRQLFRLLLMLTPGLFFVESVVAMDMTGLPCSAPWPGSSLSESSNMSGDSDLYKIQATRYI